MPGMPADALFQTTILYENALSQRKFAPRNACIVLPNAVRVLDLLVACNSFFLAADIGYLEGLFDF
jgi:hypothetical protein